MRKVLPAVIVMSLLVVSCSAGPDRSDVVGALGDTLTSLVSGAADDMARLAADASAFCDSPSEELLTTARASWLDAETAWEQAEVAIYYGPAPMLRTESKADFEPVSEPGIDELLSSETVIDFDYVDNRSAASRRGLGAVEYTLFRPLGEASDPRVCELTVAASAVASAATAELENAWTVGGEDGDEAFAEEFVDVMDSNDALADVVGAQYEILERQTLSELGVALGVTAPQPDLMALPEGASETGADRYLAQLAGIDTTLHAGGDSSLIELIRSRSSDVADGIEEAIDSATSTLESMKGAAGGMRGAVVSSPDAMSALLDDLTALRDLIEVDVVSLLDLTLGFSDSDGDTG